MFDNIPAKYNPKHTLTCVPSGKQITQSFGILVADRSWK